MWKHSYPPPATIFEWVDCMSTFAIKLIALLLMLLDHVGLVFGKLDGWGIIGDATYLRGFGRIAFPLFAFCLVNGFYKSKNLNLYIKRILIFATISQIPFSLALYTVNLMKLTDSESLNLISCNGFLIIIPICLSLGYLVVQNFNYKSNCLYLFLALIVSGISLKVNGMWVLYSGSLNVFYTLALGLLTLQAVEKLRFHTDMRFYQKVLTVALILLGLAYIGTRSDYGIPGIILILGLYFSKSSITREIMVVCIWGLVFYGIIIGNFYNAIFSCASALIILMYNRKKGPSIKYLFYIFYPLHLFLLGLMNIIFRL